MMKSRFLGAAAAAALLLLTSCLGDNNSNATYNMVPGVMKFEMTGFQLNSKLGMLSAKGLEKFSEGECLLVNISVSSKDQVSDKYTTVTLTSEPTEVPKGQFNPIMPDTAVMGETEIPIIKAFEPAYGTILAYLDGYLFLPSSITIPEDQKTIWELYADPQAKPEEVNGESVYSMFLRAKVRVEGEKKEQSILAPNAFFAKMFFDRVQATEQANKKKTYSVKVHYVKSINEKDRTEFTWAESEPIKFLVPEDEK